MIRKERLLVVSAPSGAGKTTICNRLLKEHQDRLVLSVSYTTRRPRPGEVDGREYFFVQRQEFERMVEEGQFAEWARVHDNMYGTSRRTVEELLRQGKDVLFDIDWQGAVQLRQAYPDSVSLFLLPPSLAELERRLRHRGTDDEETILRRLHNARQEVERVGEFQYAVVNRDLDEAVATVNSIYTAEGCRLSRLGAGALVTGFLDGATGSGE